MSAVFSINLSEFENLQKYLENLELTSSKKQELLADIGLLVIKQSRTRFKSKSAPDGTQWKPWKKRYSLKRASGKSLLKDEGYLKQSIVFKVSGNKLEVGSDEDYAATHQYGDNSVITRKIGRGKNKDKQTKPFNRNIPARPYLGINDEDKAEIEVEIIKYLKEQLNV